MATAKLDKARMGSAVATSACATNAQSVWQSAMVRINADNLAKVRMLPTNVAAQILATTALATSSTRSTRSADTD